MSRLIASSRLCCAVGLLLLSAASASASASLTASSVSAATLSTFTDATCSSAPTSASDNVPSDGSCTSISAVQLSGKLQCSQNQAQLQAFVGADCNGPAVGTGSGASGSCITVTTLTGNQYVKIDCGTQSATPATATEPSLSPAAATASETPATEASTASSTPAVGGAVDNNGAQAQAPTPISTNSPVDTGSAIDVANNGGQLPAEGTTAQSGTNAGAGAGAGGEAFNPAGDGTTAGNDFNAINPNSASTSGSGITIDANDAGLTESAAAAYARPSLPLTQAVATVAATFAPIAALVL